MRLLLFAACFGLAVLPGCLDAAEDDGAPAEVPGATDWAFEQVLIGPGGDAETAVTVGPDGIVLACSHGGFGQPSPSWRSLDGGDTWSRMDPQPNPLVSGDCDFTILDDGTWGLVYDTIASSTVATSRDQGTSWFLNYGSALPLGGVDRPWLASQGNTMYMVYADVMAAMPAVNTFAISHDGGRTWTEHHLAHAYDPSQPDQMNTIIGHPIVLPDAIRVPLTTANLQTGGPTTLSFAVSRNGGQTWTEEPIDGPYPSAFHLPSGGADSDGDLYVTKVEVRDDRLAIDVLVSSDDGATWAAIPIAGNVTFAGGVSGPWLDVRPDGVATLAWLSGEEEGRRVWAARLDGDRVLIPAMPLTEFVEDESIFEFMMVDHDAAGRAYLVYPLDTGDCTRTTPAAPGRNAQCVWLLRETA